MLQFVFIVSVLVLIFNVYSIIAHTVFIVIYFDNYFTIY